MTLVLGRYGPVVLAYMNEGFPDGSSDATGLLEAQAALTVVSNNDKDPKEGKVLCACRENRDALSAKLNDIIKYS